MQKVIHIKKTVTVGVLLRKWGKKHRKPKLCDHLFLLQKVKRVIGVSSTKVRNMSNDFEHSVSRSVYSVLNSGWKMKPCVV